VQCIPLPSSDCIMGNANGLPSTLRPTPHRIRPSDGLRSFCSDPSRRNGIDYLLLDFGLVLEWEVVVEERE